VEFEAAMYVCVIGQLNDGCRARSGHGANSVPIPEVGSELVMCSS
jgi:hypothetical protein